MTGRSLRLSLETLLYAAALILGMGLRLGRLDQPPLNEAEAVPALQAAATSSGGSAFWVENHEASPVSAAYHTLTALIFEAAPVTNAAARVVPAIAGTALVLVPCLARRRLGRGPALGMSFLLAISPSLVTSARTAGGTSLATLGVVLTVLLILREEGDGGRQNRMIGAFVAAALALASGPSVFGGLLGLGLGVLAARLIWGPQTVPLLVTEEPDRRRAALWTGLAVLALLATGFGLMPGTVSALPESLATWLVGWGRSGPVHPLTPLLALPIYEPLLLIFGIVGAVLLLRERDRLGRLAVGWAAGALLMALVYPSRQVADLVWVALPLSYLGGRALATVADRVSQGWSWQAHGGLVFVLAILGAIAYFQLAGYAMGRGPGIYVDLRGLSLAVVAVIVILSLVLVVLFGMGWGWPLALEAAALAGAAGLLLASLSAVWHLNFAASASGASEVWREQGYGPGLPLMVQTLEEISQAHTGRTDAIPVEFQGEVPAGLAWALRAYPEAETADPASAPEIVLAPAGSDPTGLRADYLGQEILIGERWGWTGVLPPDPVTWFILRQSVTLPDHWLLLVREDIASLGSVTGEPGVTP